MSSRRAREIAYYDAVWGNAAYKWPRQPYHAFADEWKLKPHLDVGCGSGLVKSEVYVEVSLEALKRFEGKRVLASACHLPFKDKTFASVSALELLEHLEDPFKALAEMRRVAKYRLIASVPEKGEHLDPSHKRDIDYDYYGFKPFRIEKRDHRWCIVESLP